MLKKKYILIALLLKSICPMAQNGLIGMTYSGGDEYGIIYQTKIDGNNPNTVYQFSGNSGAFPFYTQLTEINNGLLIGMSSQGGLFNQGVIYTFNSFDSSYQKILDFNGNNGSGPRGSLNWGNDGFLYGMTTSGGSNNLGVIFKIDTSDYSYTKLFDFDGTNQGSSPSGDLCLSYNGSFYGLTYQGGAFGSGILFQFNPSNNVFTKKLDFDGNTNGRNPFGSLIQATDSFLYGLTYQGGSSNLGLLFQYDIQKDSFKSMVEFDGVNKGSNPHGSLIETKNQTLMGSTFLGGIDNAGVLFSYQIQTQQFSKKQDFSASKGRNPYGNLLLASDNNIYGMAFQGGNMNGGTIYQYKIDVDSFQVLYHFSNKGRNPYGALMQTKNGSIYGLTYRGGKVNSGTIFNLDLSNNNINYIKDFNEAVLGKHPFGNLTNISKYDYFGMTQRGGLSDQGVIFYYNAEKNLYEKKFDFNGSTSGGLPHGSLCLANNNKLYGLSNSGGAYNYGTLFEYDFQQNIFIKKIDFDGSNFGRNPYGGLCIGNDSILYGMTAFGGQDDFGVIFSYNINQNKLIKILEFDDTSNGSGPFGDLIKVDSLYYGLAFQGGNNQLGVLFQFNPTNSTTSPLFHFDGIANGSYPQGNLVLANNQKLYGLTQTGGANNQGVLFDYNITNNSLNNLYSFNQTDGKSPTGSLIESQAGLLVGKTSKGGNDDQGVIFNYNYNQNSFLKTFDFETINGASPFGSFSKFCLPSRVDINTTVCDSLISASSKYVFKLSGVYNDTIDTYLGCDSIITYNLKVNNSTFSNITVKACASYTSPTNQTIDSSGQYTFKINNYLGCDSFINVDLTIQNSKSNINVSVCENYLAPNGEILNSSGIYNIVIPNHLNCDSFITIKLNIQKTHSQFIVESCDFYIAPDGKIHDTSGRIVATIPNKVLCDSIITIDLEIIKNDISVVQNDNTLEAEINGAIYQWIDCNNGFNWIENETKKTFTAEANGRYAVIIKKNNCTDTSTCYLVNNLNLNQQSIKKSIKIFPNPSNGIFHIQSDVLFKFEIKDAVGKTIQSISSNELETTVKLKHGIYFILIKTQHGEIIEKLIVW
ncbi:MAG: T9SS type A sorting domain-containing protein [Bacteroidota bacterium]|nr:T9SS type A sorting domain-containing protein [Bacteroidota bacterium]